MKHNRCRCSFVMPVICRGLLVLMGVALAEAARTAPLEQEMQTTVAALRYSPTIHSIGFELDIMGDANHNGRCAVRYRPKGTLAWKDSLGLLRIDYRGWYGFKNGAKQRESYKRFNMFAGSLMFLQAGAEYDVELAVNDPDGGAWKKTLAIATRGEPTLFAPARTLHVAPGEGGGDGTATHPFHGLKAADDAAQPSDLFLLHEGTYAGATLTKSGSPGKYIAFKQAAQARGAAIITSALGIAASHVWIEGLTFNQGREYSDAARHDKEFGGIRGNRHRHSDLVVARCTFNNCRYAWSNTDQSWNGDAKELDQRWYLADNIVNGGKWTEYGARLYMLADADICYNRISMPRVPDNGGDAVSLRFCNNIDVYGNDINNIDDDAFEPDSAYANIRIWKNRCLNPKFQGVSFQPMLGAPWYIVRNEFVLARPERSATPLKTNVFDRTVQVNNTFYVRGRYGQSHADIMFRAFSRNNLWVHQYDNKDQKTNPGGAIWSGYGDEVKDEQYTIHGQTNRNWMTDIDYDGFAWDHVPDMVNAFWWFGGRERYFKDLASFAKAKGVERHGVQLQRDQVFEISDVVAYSDDLWSARRLTLKKDSQAIDAGIVVPGLCEEFAGAAPDLGAYEFGTPPTHYGPRSGKGP